MAENTHAVGIDIGGTSAKFGIVDPSGKILFQNRIPTNTHHTFDSFLDELYEELNPILNQLSKKNIISGIGIGAPNGNRYSGCIEYAPNLLWKGIIPIAHKMEERFHLKTLLSNDANAAAMGEMIYGACKNIRHFICITLGTGVGSGIVIDGNLVLGHDGFAGELGHTIIRPGGRLHTGTGSRGSLEAYACASGICQTAVELLAEFPDVTSSMRSVSPDKLTSELIYEFSKNGDLLSLKVFEETGKILGEALANFVMFSSPELIVLFGGLAQAGEILFNPVKQSMENNLLPIFRNKVKIIPSALPSADAAILGAAALINQ